MKSLILKSTIIASLICSAGIFTASAQEEVPQYIGMGLGPVVSISETYASLPSEIKTFIVKHFPSSLATEIEKKTFQNIYEIELSTGYELSFYATGQLLEIEAPKNSSIPISMVKELLPLSVYNYIHDRKIESIVKSIKHDIKTGYKIELRDLYFDIKGKHIDAPILKY